jgi:hypothetical protein
VDSIVNYLDKYSDLIFDFQIGFLVIILSVFVWVWYYNRKKYNHLKHQIPASVVKSYLDSIIQNSTALKSSLFRGGGLDVDPSSVPSVMPLQDLPGTTAINIGGAEGGDDSALRAQIAALQTQLAQKTSIVTDLEAKNAELEGVVKQKQERIEELEKLLAAAGSGESADPAALIAMTAERDQLKEELQQYDIISNDIADMKRLKQENEQLKKALADAGASAPQVPAEPAASAPPVEEIVAAVEEPVPAEPAIEAAPAVAEEVAVEEPPATEEASEEVVAAAEETPAADDKSPEDLLSEFEKMLG